MIWLLILSLMLVVFLNRYLLLEPKLPIVIPYSVKQALNYSAPCLLTAICGPIILNGTGLSELITNPYLYATIFSVICAYFIRSMLFSVVISLCGFYFILFLFDFIW